jgi:dihydrofolate synthase / folylpolyglutamate synthase
VLFVSFVVSASQPSIPELNVWLARLEQAHPTSIELGLERVARVRDAMGLHLPFPVILVGGTNGKGSTSAYLDTMLHEQGYKTGLYTSPHLLSYNERVCINRKSSSDEAIVAALDAVEVARGETSLTYFEHGTLGAVWQFVHEKVDVVILEVGLGGRLDAVNVFEPDVSIVTGVDLDHQDWLGTDREAIGFEKAGIFRTSKPAICADPSPPRSLIAHARKIGADLQLLNTDFSLAHRDNGWDLNWRGQTLSGLPVPAMPGEHQLRNAAAAIAGLLNLRDRLPIDDDAIRQGLHHASVAGRFHKVADKPEVILDVAHNPEAARALAANLKQRPIGGRTLAVFALLADKDMQGVVLPLKELVDDWYVCGLEGPRSLPVETQAQQMESVLQAGALKRYPTPAEGFEAAISAASEDDRILVFGSFHTVASVLATHPTWQFR